MLCRQPVIKVGKEVGFEITDLLSVIASAWSSSRKSETLRDCSEDAGAVSFPFSSRSTTSFKLSTVSLSSLFCITQERM